MDLAGILNRCLRALGRDSLPPLNPDLTSLERVFRAPALTPELIAAIRLISPQFNLTDSEKSREYWEADQNGCSWGECNALAPLFRSMQRPARILEDRPRPGTSLRFSARSWVGRPARFTPTRAKGARPSTLFSALASRTRFAATSRCCGMCSSSTAFTTSRSSTLAKSRLQTSRARTISSTASTASDFTGHWSISWTI